MSDSVYTVKIGETEGEIISVGEINITLPKKPATYKVVGNKKAKKYQKWDRELFLNGMDIDKDESDYTEEDIKFIEEDFNRRLNGVWLMINGNATYITGLHYFYLMWCKIDVGYPDYRDRDRRFFYFWEACVVDKDSFGMIMVKHRREGATYKGAAIIIEVIIRSFNANGGILSKTGTDAKEFFNKLVKMFRSLPKFYQPLIAGSDNPKTVLEFDKPGERITKKSQKIKKSEALSSKIEWKNTAENSFDSYKLKRLVSDEGGKWEEANIINNYAVVKPTLTQGRGIVGKIFMPSTVNEMTRKGGKNFKVLWNHSDPNDRGKNNRTKSGMYRYFVPAYDGFEGYIDEYGNSIIYAPEEPIMGIDGEWITDGAKDYLDEERERLKNDPSALAEFKRQFPYTIEEAFMVEAKDCAFQSEFLYSQFDWNEVHAGKLITIGDFVWGNEFGGDVKFVPSKRGKWSITWVPEKENQNKRIYRDGRLYPGNIDSIVSSCDPYDHNTTTDGTRSKGASYVMRMYDPNDDDNSNMPVSQYINRPPTSFLFYEDMLKQCIFYGTQILAENNKIGIVNWFIEKGFGNYLMKRPEVTNTEYSKRQKTPGIPTTGDSVRDALVSAIEAYVYNYVGYREEMNMVGKIYFNELVEDLLTFEVDNWTKYDATVAFGLALLATKKRINKPKQVDVKIEFVRSYKIVGGRSHIIKKY